MSKGAIDVLHAVGVISDAEADKGIVPGLERAIPKNKGVEFASLLQQLAAELVASPGSGKLKNVLSEIDPQYKDRLTARQARLEAQAAADAVAAKEARDKARADARAAAAEAKSPARSAKGGKDAPRHAAPPPTSADGERQKAKDKEAKGKLPPIKKKEEPVAASKEARRSPSKGLAKKKPR